LEYADNGNLHDMIKAARLSGEDKMPSIDKLRICVQVAQGVAALHSFEKNGVPSLSHNDIDCQQFVNVDGVYKLNDFHWAEFIPKHAKTNEMCRMYSEAYFGTHYYKTRPVEAFDDEVKVDFTKIDTYSLGNIMWYVLTKHWMFEGEHVKQVSKKVRKGKRPAFPPRIPKSRDPAIVAIRKAIIDCWTHDPDDRPTSLEVRDFLKDTLNNITDVEELGVVRVAIPPLLNDFRHTSTDFYESMLW